MKRNLISICLFIIISIAGYAQQTDAYGGFLDIKGEKTGFFHTEQINNRWWLVTPEGNGFYGIGIAHPITGFTQAAVHFTFGSDQEAWLKGSIQRMRDLGFNCVWSGPYCPERLQSDFVDKELAEKIFSEAKIPYVFPLPLIKHNVELKEGEKQPDVFSTEYLQYVKDLVAKYAPKIQDNNWVMGYYYGFGSWDNEEKWINTTLERKDSPGRKRLLGILEAKYQGDIRKFNKVYGSDYESFSDLIRNGTLEYPKWIKRHKFGLAEMPKTEGAQEMYDDAQDLIEEIIVHVYKLGHEEIRKYDKNHMILGSYVKEATLTKETWQRVAPFIDVIAPQHVSKAFPIEPIVKLLGKPALISDQPLGNVYSSHLLMTKAAYGPVPDHVDRLVIYDILANRISKAPEFIGIDICSCLYDQSHPNKAYELGQPGFFTIEGESKHHLCRTAKELNNQVLKNVKAQPDTATVKALDLKYHEVRSRYTKVINDRKELLRKYPANEYSSEF